MRAFLDFYKEKPIEINVYNNFTSTKGSGLFIFGLYSGVWILEGFLCFYLFFSFSFWGYFCSYFGIGIIGRIGFLTFLA